MDVTRDQFLGGGVVVQQPTVGYRSGLDPVLLAAACPAKPGQSVLELGCGVGVASLCLAHRVAGVSLHGVEIMADYAQLARENAVQNGAEINVQVADISSRPTPFWDQSFDHVIMNPPYFEAHRGVAPADIGRLSGRSEAVDLNEWIVTAAKRLKPKGYLTMIQRVERLPETLCRLQAVMGSVKVQPLMPRAEADAHLVLVQARKSGRAPFQLCAARPLHDGAVYTIEVESILRHGHPLIF